MMTLSQFLALWPVLLWATVMVFLAGGVWVTLIRMGRDLRDMKPLLEKITPLEVRVDAAEGEILRLRDRSHDLAGKVAGIALHANGD